MTMTAPDLPPDEIAPRSSESQWRIVLRRFQHHRMAMVSLVVLVVLVLASVFAPVIAPYPEDRFQHNLDRKYVTPLSVDDEGNRHILGTDHLGRDYLTRLIFAARVSLTIAITVASIATIIGITLGLLAGYFGGWVDVMITRFVEFVSTFPLFVVLLILLSILLESEEIIPLPQVFVNMMAFVLAIADHEAKKVTLLIIGLSLLIWTNTARLMRGMVFSVREQPYIESSRALGGSHWRIIRKHVFPNAFPPLIVDYTLQLNLVLILEASLSFLGFGVQDPTPTWGNMLTAAKSYMFQHPWMPLLPGLPILIVSLAVNYIGDGLRDALDPRMKL